MKNIVLLAIIFLLFSCNGQEKKGKDLTDNDRKIPATNKKYTQQQMLQIVDSIKYDYDGNGDDYVSDFERKIVALDKAVVPLLLEKLDDTTSTKKIVPLIGPYYKVGDRAYDYISQIYINTAKKTKSENYYFLTPSEEAILINIMPNIKKYRNPDNRGLYWIYMYNTENKMSELERRKRYKEEFIKALNKDLLKPE